MIPIGSIIADKYRVESLLGEGAMGAVVAATHLELDKSVAIKLMKPSVAHAAGLDRFTHEARGVARLRSAHTCQVLDFGRLPDGAPYIVMEMLEGEPLENYADRQGRLPFAEVARYMLDICDALEEAHAAGIVHRDLKPGNLFRVHKTNGSAFIKVLDFGVSKFQRGPSAFETTEHAVIGTPAYMSPEQLRSSRDVDGRSDIWALGVVMYQLISGALPFAADTFLELVTSIATTEVVAPADLDLEARRIVFRCLQKDASDRYGSVVELANDLAPHAARVIPWRPARTSNLSAVAPTAAAPTTLGSAASESVSSTARRPIRIFALAGGVAVLTIMAIATASIVGSTPATAPSRVDSAKPVAPVDAAITSDTTTIASEINDATPPVAPPTATPPVITPPRRPPPAARPRPAGPVPVDAGVPVTVDVVPDALIDRRVTPLDPIQQRVKTP